MLATILAICGLIYIAKNVGSCLLRLLIFVVIIIAALSASGVL